MTNFWMVRAGERGVFASAFEQRGCVAIGWIEAGDVSGLDSPEAVRSRVDERYAGDSPITRGQHVGQLSRFRNAMRIGDRVVTFDGARREYLLGTIAGEYEYQPDVIPGYPHVRRVHWDGRVSRDALRQESQNALGSLLTIFEPGERVRLDLEEALVAPESHEPSGSGDESVDRERLERLFGEFERGYLTADAGKRHREAYEAGRTSARANYDEIVRRVDAGEEVTDLVLSRLLPHSDSVRHRERGDWIHVAPAIAGDIRSWYESSGLATPDEWPARALHILRFVRRIVSDPGELTLACEEFTASPLSRGFQGGMITPILSALRPEDFALVNSKACRLFEAFTGDKPSASLADYPQVNGQILALVETHRDVFGRAAAVGVSALEAFDMMSHWYVAVRVPDPEPPVTGPGQVLPDRDSAAAARAVLEFVCSDPSPRSAALEGLARSIRVAHGLSRTAWSVTLKKKLFRLNVGGIFVFDIRAEGVVLVVHHRTLDRYARRRFEKYESGEFNYLPAAVAYVIPFDALDPTLDEMWAAHEELIRQVVAKSEKAPYKSAHSPGILAMLREAGHEVPSPAWAPGGEPRVERPVHSPFTLQQAAEETHIDVATLEAWVRAINRKGQAILYGPPGTGKTYVAERLRRHLLSGGDGHTDLVQFHPAYAYEDFIQGLRPRSTSDGGLTYEMVPGRFMEFCEEASRRSGVSVLIIDEINRANLAQVFGELMYLLEYRDRELPLAGGRRLRIPPKVRIIGTMNTADRSIALVDHALRRRFAFLRLDPKAEVLHRFHASKNQDVGGLIGLLAELNDRIGDPHYSVGISYFLRENLATDLEAIWTGEIEPYVEELFFDRKSEVAAFRWPKVRERVRLIFLDEQATEPVL